MSLRFKFNSVFAEVFTTDKRIIDVWGGRGRGGSHFITDYALFLLTQPHYFRGYFVRQVFNDIRGSLFQDLRDRIEGNPTLNPDDFAIQEQSMRVTHKATGNVILSRGISKERGRTAQMKSLAGATHVFMEEADEVGESDFDQMNISLRTTKVEKIQILRCFNPPPKTHWIWRDYNITDIEKSVRGVKYTFGQATPKTTSDILSIHSTYRDNIKNINSSTLDTLLRFKERDPYYYYNQVEGLIGDGAKGRIYTGWQTMTDAEFEEVDSFSVYSLDFGYSNDPTALVQTKWDRDHRYHRELLYERELGTMELAHKLHDLGVEEEDLIVADTGGGGDRVIVELRRGVQGKEGYPDVLRYNIKPTIKGAGSIIRGIMKVKECVNHYTEGSANLAHELHNYTWAMDANKNPTNRPVDADNHAMDCIRYFELNKGITHDRPI